MNIRFKLIDTEYALTSDAYQVILSEVFYNKSGKNAGEERLRNQKYFSDELKALAYLADKQMLKSEAVAFKELVEYRQRVLSEIETIINNYKFKEN